MINILNSVIHTVFIAEGFNFFLCYKKGNCNGNKNSKCINLPNRLKIKNLPFLRTDFYKSLLFVLNYFFLKVLIKLMADHTSSESGIFFLKEGISSRPSEIL